MGCVRSRGGFVCKYGFLVTLDGDMREQIREGIKHEVARGGSYDTIVENIVKRLDSQGVVIKVDENRLPVISYHSAYPENEEIYQRAMIDAGYVAVESLLESDATKKMYTL